MHGKNRIGNSLIESSGSTLKAFNPASQTELAGDFQTIGKAEVDQALQKASEAYKSYGKLSGNQKAAFLEAIADEILNLGDALVERVVAESALPTARIIGERGRTINQLKLFASLLCEGSWVDASIDTAIPNREPLPKSDIRKFFIPVGPVVVFTASNFPLAFSTAGGDTASALAAGNPVIVKAHESHLGTNELISEAIAKAAERTGMPDGVFSSLVGAGYEVGQELVKHPLTKSVAFTGSLKGGMALHQIAAQREEPIPVFAEMGSINPVLLLPSKLTSETEALAQSLAGSITLGVGQFCTNPGLMVGLQSDALSQFAKTLGQAIAETQPGTMLNTGISSAYGKNAQTILDQAGVKPLSEVQSTAGNHGSPLVATVSGKEFINNPHLAEEVFGPFSLLVVCESDEELQGVVQQLPGQLTCTVMSDDEDVANYAATIQEASAKCGRLIFNGVPTGVEVCHSMQHGGPYPASTDSRFTSVGTDAIKRFVRPVSFQDAPEAMLPDELKDGNPLGIWRKVDGNLSKEPIK